MKTYYVVEVYSDFYQSKQKLLVNFDGQISDIIQTYGTNNLLSIAEYHGN